MNQSNIDTVLHTAEIAHYFYLKNDEDKIILCNCEDVYPQMQSGPECGIVALSMATQLLVPKFIDKNVILREAQKKKFSLKGEMFSASDMAELAESVCSCNALVLSDLQNNKRSIITHVLSGSPVLIPYDADHNHCPCTNKGRNAHWAVVIGVGIAVPKLKFFDDLSTLPMFVPHLYFSNTSNVFSYLDAASSIFVFVRQGKTKRLDVWELEELLKSNTNMTEVSKKYDRSEMILPEDDALSELRDKAVLLFSNNITQQIESEFFQSKIFVQIDRGFIPPSVKEKYFEQMKKSLHNIHSDTGVVLSLKDPLIESKAGRNSERAYIHVEHSDMKTFQKAVISASALVDKINLDFAEWCDSATEQIHPTDIGLRFKPPAIILFYEDSLKNLHRRTMPVRGLRKNSVVNQLLKDIKQRHSIYLENVPVFKIEKMIRLLQEHMRGNNLEDALDIVEKDYEINPEEDLNALDDETLSRKKEIMNETFLINQKAIGDPDFEYDIQMDFSSKIKEKSVWDIEEDEKYDDF